MVFGGLQKTTLLDYPGQVAATVFTAGCNFRCPFCHNADLVLQPELSGSLSEDLVLDFLKKRKGVLSGVCISGGEPTLQKELPDFIRKVKKFGYQVKLDTNGYLPQVVENLLSEGLLDYLAMDIKGGFFHYEELTGQGHIKKEQLECSIRLIEHSGLPYEFRTTVVKELHNDRDFEEISELLSPASPYFIQSFTDSGHIIAPGFHACSREQLEHYLSLVLPRLPQARLRGID